MPSVVSLELYSENQTTGRPSVRVKNLPSARGSSSFARKNLDAFLLPQPGPFHGIGRAHGRVPSPPSAPSRGRWAPLFEALKNELPEDSVHHEIGLDPDDDRLLQTKDAEFLRFMKGWPRSRGEYALFYRRIKYAGFITMVTKGALGQLPQMFTDETTDQSVDFDPAARLATMKREPLV